MTAASSANGNAPNADPGDKGRFRKSYRLLKGKELRPEEVPGSEDQFDEEAEAGGPQAGAHGIS